MNTMGESTAVEVVGYEVEGGFAYSLRAFKFLEFALDYEGKVEIPKKFPERNIVSYMQPDEFKNIMRK